MSPPIPVMFGMFSAKVSEARVVKVPLTKTYAHDVKAMIAAAPDAGVFYICSPNNPTGTLTPHSDIEYLVENKPKGSIVMVDEAYIHFCDATSTFDLVKAGKDVVVLRTFSKALRDGRLAMRVRHCPSRPARQDHEPRWLEFHAHHGCGRSLGQSQRFRPGPERKRINATIRRETFQWLDRNGYSYTPSESNCFLLETKRPGKEVIDAMAEQNVFIGRIWPIMPTCVRITVGTHEEMERFQAALQKVMKGTTAFSLRRQGLSGIRARLVFSCRDVNAGGDVIKEAQRTGKMAEHYSSAALALQDGWPFAELRGVPFTPSGITGVQPGR